MASTPLELLKLLAKQGKGSGYGRANVLKKSDANAAKSREAQDMEKNMSMGEEGNFRIDPDSGVMIPVTVDQNAARALGVETSHSTYPVNNANVTRINNSKAEWAAIEAEEVARIEAARAARYEAARDRYTPVDVKKSLSDEYVAALEAQNKPVVTPSVGTVKGGVGSKSGNPEVLAKKAETKAMNRLYESTSRDSQLKYGEFVRDNRLNYDTLLKMVYNKWVNPATVKNPVSFEGAINKLQKLDGSDFKNLFPNANKNTGQLRTIEKNRLKRIEADKLEADALKVLKEEEERRARIARDSGIAKREYTGDQKFDISKDGFIKKKE